MRPPDLPGGNYGWKAARGTSGFRFNEAAGFTRRKRFAVVIALLPMVAGFNEAAGFTRRKRTGINSSLSRQILTGLRGVTGDPYVGRGSVGIKGYYIR